VLASTHLIVNTTARSAAGFHIAAAGRDADVPVLHAWVSAGAWGGRILLQSEGSGCPKCLALWQEHGGHEVPEISEDPDAGEVTEQGCADATFTGPGVDIAEVAAICARTAIGVLLADIGGYPPPANDLLTIRLRGANDTSLEVVAASLPIHPDCDICS
jgi:hypothetical protein